MDGKSPPIATSETPEGSEQSPVGGALPGERSESQGGGWQGENDDLEKLQQLLLGDTAGTSGPLSPEAVAGVLPQALLQAQAQQQQLTLASVPTVESAIRASVNRDARVLSEALFPVIGPAARKSVSAAIDNLVQSFNQALEYSLSLQSFNWRVEAWRTGKSFAEVVLLRTLVYQVEQVLLIHRQTGLVLQHAVRETVVAQDPDMVSAMLTALQDFVKDSFSLASGDSLDALELGEFTLWLEEGPQAAIACVIRGTAPQELRETLRQSLEKIHLLFGQQLRTFAGDRAELVESKPYLDDCFQARFDTRQTEVVPSRWRRVLWWGVLGTIALLTVARIAGGYRAQQRWSDYVDLIEGEPGITVIASGRSRGKYYLRGLRDPLAADPLELLQGTSLDPERVEMSWEVFSSLAPDLIETRVRAVLNPPPTVTLTLDREGVLRLSGRAPEQWIQQARGLGYQLGLAGWDDSQLVSTDRQLIGDLEGRIESRQFDFLLRQSQVQSLDRAGFYQQARDISRLLEVAEQLGKQAQIIIIGYGDRGAPNWDALGRSRAESIQQVLVGQGVDAARLATEVSPTALPAESAVRFAVELRNLPQQTSDAPE